MLDLAKIRKGIQEIPFYALLMATAFGAASAHAEQIRVLNWQGYGTDETWAVEAFEAQTGIEVEHDYFTSELEMLTKLRTNPGAYDVVMINSAHTLQAAEEGLIQPIDVSDMDNVVNLTPGFGDNPNLVQDDAVYGVAWVWGLTSFAINTDAVENAPTSIEALWSEEFAGRVGLRDDGVETAMFAALATGQDINNPGDLDVIRDRMRALKPQVRLFWSSENEWNQYISSGEFDIATYWSGSAARAANFGLPVSFVIPEEGAIGWLDGLSIPTGSENVEGAKAFINWMIDPEFYVRWDTTVGAPASANAAAAAALPEDAFNRAVMGDAEKLANVQMMAPMDDAMREKLVELWQETKTYMQE